MNSKVIALAAVSIASVVGLAAFLVFQEGEASLEIRRINSPDLDLAPAGLAANGPISQIGNWRRGRLAREREDDEQQHRGDHLSSPPAPQPTYRPGGFLARRPYRSKDPYSECPFAWLPRMPASAPSSRRDALWGLLGGM